MFSALASSCNSFNQKPIKQTDFVKIEYATSKNVALREISGAIKVPFKNLSLTQGFSGENDADITYINLEINDYLEAMESNEKAYESSKAILKVLKQEINNVDAFDQIILKYYIEENLQEVNITRQNSTTFTINQ